MGAPDRPWLLGSVAVVAVIVVVIAAGFLIVALW